MSFNGKKMRASSFKHDLRHMRRRDKCSRAQRMTCEILLDVRSLEEWNKGHLENAQHFPLAQLEAQHEFPWPKHSSILCYCSAGVRAARAVQHLQACGFCNAHSLHGRYQRQTLLPEVGIVGQKKLQESRVLMVGVGGLGSPAALYLAAAGVGTLGLIDHDAVQLSNLHRQILHTTARVNMPKVLSAAESLRALNPETQLELFQEKLNAENAAQIISPFDVVLDGSDNLPTRYLLADTCWQLSKPLVHGSVHRFEGHITVFERGKGPCYRCLHQDTPHAADIPSCQEAGVLGVLPGMIGVMQATEALKILLNMGQTLTGRMLIYQALEARWTEFTTSTRANCQCTKTHFTPVVEHHTSTPCSESCHL